MIVKEKENYRSPGAFCTNIEDTNEASILWKTMTDDATVPTFLNESDGRLFSYKMERNEHSFYTTSGEYFSQYSAKDLVLLKYIYLLKGL